MKPVRIVHLLMLSFLLISFSTSRAVADDADLARLFKDRNVNGVMVISSLKGDVEYVHNASRADQQFLPASTFKIINTLIALDQGAIKDENEVIKWDGKNRGVAAWNQDQTLSTAFPASCVWFYQELAKRVGQEAYLKHLKAINYGNQKTGPDVTTFWLNGDLKISANEQIEMLKRVYADDLPYKKNHLQILKKVMIVDRTPQYTIRAKTGLTARVTSHIGWYVGYVEIKDNVWFFTLNMDITDKKQIAFRKEIVIEGLKAKGIL